MTDISKRAPDSVENRSKPLRFITCGNVDDGKSTLMGRLLWDTKSVKSDQQSSIEKTTITLSDGDTHPDYAHLLDGLQAEREQGITIDVAYRYFSTKHRSFIVADTPGHEQYTRNMVTGASTADLAVLLIDAQTGITEQTRRHAMVASMMGIQELILVINKMDLVNYEEARFLEIHQDFQSLIEWFSIKKSTTIPTAAVHGYNVVFPEKSKMAWYQGPTLLQCLESAQPKLHQSNSFSLCVQRVSRPNEKFRGFQGTIVDGSVKLGQQIIVLPSNQKAQISQICTCDGNLDEALIGDAVTLVLDRKIDISRGDIIADALTPPDSGNHLLSKLIVFDDQGLVPNKRYWLKTQSRQVRVTLTPKTQINLNTGDWEKDRETAVNSIIQAQLRFEEPFYFRSYEESKAMGSFILIDPDSHSTVAGGMFIDKICNADNRQSDNLVTLSMPEHLAHEILSSKQFHERSDEITFLQKAS